MDTLTLTGFYRYLNKILGRDSRGFRVWSVSTGLWIPGKGMLLENIEEDVQIKKFEVADSSERLKELTRESYRFQCIICSELKILRCPWLNCSHLELYFIHKAYDNTNPVICSNVIEF